MNVDDSPLSRRSRHPNGGSLESPHAQLPGTFAFSRNLKADSVSTRSPFSKLSNSKYNIQTPVKTVDTQSQQYSENASERGSSRLYPNDFARHPTLSGRASFHDGLAIELAHRSPLVYSASQLQPRSNAATTLKTERNDYFDFGEAHAAEHSFGSTSVSRYPQQSFKKESDGFSSPFHEDEGFQNNRRNKNITPSETKQAPAYRPNTPHRYDSPVNDKFDFQVVGQERSAEQHSLSQGINTNANRSRCSSIAVSSRDQTGDDLSTLLFKGATDLRNTNHALEEKTKALQRLKEELDTVTAEKNGLLKQVALVKGKAKDMLESYAKTLGDMSKELRSLKDQSQTFFSFAQEAKSSMADVKALREVVKESTDQLGIVIGEDGIYAPTQGWKSVLAELQTDISNKQQVIDMFRDRIEFTQGELADAKNRSAELESLQSQNSNALRSTSEQLGDSGKRITELASLLRIQQQDNTDVLTKNVALETRVDTLVNDNTDLRHRLSQKETEVQAFTALQREHEVTLELLKDREEQISFLRDTKERLAKTAELLNDRELKIHTLEAAIKDTNRSLEATHRSILLAEADVVNHSSLSRRLEEDLNTCRAQLQTELEYRAQILSEKDALRSHETTFITEANELKSELQEYKIKLRQYDTRYEMLQERFEDQVMMLQMEKKSHGDMQERLLSAEAAYAETIENSKKKAIAETEQWVGRVSTLEALLRDRQIELSNKAHETSTTLADIEAKHAQRTRELEDGLIARSDEVARLQRELHISEDEAESLRGKTTSLQLACNNLQVELSEAARPSQAQTDALVELKGRIDHLQKTNETLSHRALTIISRYEQGDLTAEEKKLIDTIHRASQTAHEQHLVVKGNEIRQRDNIIKTLEKRKSELESQLARVLNSQANARPAPPDGGQSLIDLEGWVSSQASTSPITAKAKSKVPDRDRPITTEERNNRISTLRAEGSVTPPAKSHQHVRANVSPPQALPFVKLAEKTADLDDELDELDDDILFAESIAQKRKREPAVTAVEDPEKSRPLRRTRTATRTKSRAVVDTKPEVPSAKESVVAPKVKARKRR